MGLNERRLSKERTADQQVVDHAKGKGTRGFCLALWQTYAPHGPAKGSPPGSEKRGDEVSQ